MKNDKLYFYTGKTLSTIKSEIIEARETARREARRNCSGCHIASRGTHIATLNADGQCRPCPEADAIDWNGTAKEIVRLIEECIKSHPDVTKVYIGGGFDAAQNLREYLDGIYDPWVESWDVDIWINRNAVTPA